MPYKFAVAVMFAAILVLCSARPGLADNDAGQVMTFNGDCFVVVGDQRNTLKVGDAVHVGDVIEVPNGAKLKLLMADGSILSLAAGTKMTIKNYDNDPATGKRDAQLSLDNGLLRSVVAKATDDSKFEVSTATGVAAARSTDWFVETNPEETTVSVLEGTVAVARRDDADNPNAPANPNDKTKAGVKTAAKPGTKTAKKIPKTGKEQDILLTAYSASEIDAGKEPPKVMPWTPDEFNRLINRTSVRFGWCQCIADKTVIKAACLPSRSGCEATCTGALYSYVPDAREACAPFYAESLSRRRGMRH